MSEACYEPSNCSNEDCQRLIVSNHEITSSQFNRMVAAFFGATIPEPKVICASDMEDLMDVDCSTFRVTFKIPETTDTNKDIVFEVVEGYSQMDGSTNNYSIALFKGLLLMKPDSFLLYKGKADYGDTVTFQLKRGGVIIYCGNLSQAYP